jgi:hypothetical protein
VGAGAGLWAQGTVRASHAHTNAHHTQLLMSLSENASFFKHKKRVCFHCVAPPVLLCGMGCCGVCGVWCVVRRVVEVVEPAARKAGIKVDSVDTLIAKLKNEAGVI